MMSSNESSPSSQSGRTREKRIGGSKRGPIWDHYDEVTTDANGQSVMRCQECSKEKEQPANKLGNSRDDDQPNSKKSRIQDALTDVLAIPAYR
uniref:BED-type domain-containing protein n=1 Tax=Ditylenchus dipsaci TaxID=166011 RepID=A0A915DM58_9BILA